MTETKTIPVPTNSLNKNYILYERPSRICLVCGELQRKEATVVCEDGAWLCDRCRNTLLKLIKENEEDERTD